MSKLSDFYAAVIADENCKKELEAILNGKNINEVSEEELVLIGKLAESKGYDISIEEAKSFLFEDECELDDGDLDAVAGGDKGDVVEKKIYICPVGGQQGVDENNFGENAKLTIHGDKSGG